MNPRSCTDNRVPPGSSPPPIALAELLDRCMGNATVAALVLNKFEKQARSDVEAIAGQLAAGDSAGLASTAHALKGAAGAVAAAALHDLAAKIETCARQDQLDAIVAEFTSLRSELERCLRHLPTALQTLTSATSGGAAGTGTSR